MTLTMGLAAAPGAPADASAAAPWHEVRTPHFTIYSDLPLEDAQALAATSEQTLAALDRLSASGSPMSPQPVTFFAFGSDHPLFETTAGSFLQPLRDGLVGVFQAREEPLQAIRRQVVYRLLDTAMPGLPEWFLQGVAEFYSTLEVDDSEVRVGLPNDDFFWYLRNDRQERTPLPEILQADRAMAERIDDFVPRAWSCVHYLTFADAELRDRVGDYLRRIRELERPHRAFRAAFGITYDELERRVGTYYAGDRIAYWRIAGALPQPSFVTRALADFEAELRLTELWLYAAPHRLDETVARLENLTRQDPESAEAFAALARARIQLADWSGAAQALRQSVDLDPRSAASQLLLGEALLEIAPSSLDSDPLRVEAVEALERGVRGAPESARGLELLSFAYAGLPRPTDRALEVGEAAVAAQPGRTDLVFNLLLMRAKRRDIEGVRELVQRLAALEADPGLVTRGREMQLQLMMQETRELMKAQRLEDALALLAVVRARTVNETLRTTADEWLERVEAVRQHNQFVERYNRAVVAYDSGLHDEALATLQQLASDARPGRQREAVAHLQAEVEYWRD